MKVRPTEAFSRAIVDVSVGSVKESAGKARIPYCETVYVLTPGSGWGTLGDQD